MTAAWSHKGSSTLYGLWLPRCYFLSWSTVILGTEHLHVGKDTSIFVGQTETHPWCVFQTLVHTSMNWEYPWPPHKIWHQHIKEVQLYTPVHSSNLDHTWKVCSHLYLLPVTLWLISEFGCMVTLFASSARFKGNCWCLLTLDELIWRPYNRKESWPGIILHWTFSPPELTLMRLWVFVVEMKIPTIPQEKINHLPSEIQPKKTVGSHSLQKNVIFNYYPHHLMTLLLSYLQFLIFVWM